jgi:hypothetical protein
MVDVGDGHVVHNPFDRFSAPHILFKATESIFRDSMRRGTEWHFEFRVDGNPDIGTGFGVTSGWLFDRNVEVERRSLMHLAGIEMHSQCAINRRIQNRYSCAELCLSGGIRGATWSFGTSAGARRKTAGYLAGSVFASDSVLRHV